MTDARFPPPGGQAGYREPSQPSIDIEPEPLPHKKIVIATRPDDPEIAVAKATYPKTPRRDRSMGMRRNFIVAMVFIGVILLVALVETLRAPPRPVRAAPTNQLPR